MKFFKIARKQMADQRAKALVAAGAVVTGTTNSFAAATNFADAVPSSLLPDGFWPLVALVMTTVVAIGGVVIGIKLTRKARG